MAGNSHVTALGEQERSKGEGVAAARKPSITMSVERVNGLRNGLHRRKYVLVAATYGDGHLSKDRSTLWRALLSVFEITSVVVATACAVDGTLICPHLPLGNRLGIADAPRRKR